MFILNSYLTWLVAALSLLLTALSCTRFEFDSFITAAIAVLILGLFNRW